MVGGLDSYSFFARLVPGLLAWLPVGLAVSSWIPDIAVQLGVVGVVPVMLAFVLSQSVRDRGKAIEPLLWESWGGAPTTIAFRHSTETVSDVSRAERHRLARTLAPELHVPTLEEEAQDPTRADEKYEAIVTRLRELTRKEDDYPLVAKENTQYGFRRNALGMKSVGLLTSVLSVACAVAVWMFTARLLVVHLVVAIALVFWWALIVEERWVRVPAFAYAERLVEAMVTLARSLHKS